MWHQSIFWFKGKLDKRREHYLNAYGIPPEFKVRIHLVKVVTAEMAKLKRELALHGDTINTAVCIREKCSIPGKKLLVSKKQKTAYQAVSV